MKGVGGGLGRWRKRTEASTGVTMLLSAGVWRREGHAGEGRGLSWASCRVSSNGHERADSYRTRRVPLEG